MWKIGDRVVVTSKALLSDFEAKFEIGHKGTVINIRDNNSIDPEKSVSFLIEFDECINGHDGNGIGKVKGKSGYCWWMRGGLNSDLIKWDDFLSCTPLLVCKKIEKKRKNNFY